MKDNVKVEKKKKEFHHFRVFNDKNLHHYYIIGIIKIFNKKHVDERKRLKQKRNSIVFILFTTARGDEIKIEPFTVIPPLFSRDSKARIPFHGCNIRRN